MERYRSAAMAAAVLLGMAVAGQVVAQDASAKAEAPKAEAKSMDFDAVDTNHDGFISRSEVPKELNDLRSHFDQYDQNHDHRLSKGEYMTALAALDAKACTDDQKVTTAKCNLGVVDNSNLRQRQEYDHSPARYTPPAHTR